MIDDFTFKEKDLEINKLKSSEQDLRNKNYNLQKLLNNLELE